MINVRTIIELWPTKSNGQWPTKPKIIYLLENGMIQGMILQEKSIPQLIGLKSTRLKTQISGNNIPRSFPRMRCFYIKPSLTE